MQIFSLLALFLNSGAFVFVESAIPHLMVTVKHVTSCKGRRVALGAPRPRLPDCSGARALSAPCAKMPAGTRRPSSQRLSHKKAEFPEAVLFHLLQTMKMLTEISWSFL